MADVYKYIVIIAGLTILFNLAGIQTGAGLILDKLGVELFDNPQNIGLGNMFIQASAALTLAGLAGISIGLFVRDNPTTFLLIGYATLLMSFVADMIAISVYANATYAPWVGYTVYALLVPISLGYVHSVISWWAGK